MKDSNLKDWLIPLLAAFAIYLPLSTVAPSPERQSSAQPQTPAFIQVSPTVTPTPAPALGPGRVSGEAARLLCDFFGLEPDQNGGLNPQQKSEAKNRRGDYCRIKSALSLKASERLGYGKIEYLIATVPDPIDTRLDHQFDRAMDAIQHAIGSADYLFDRYWLPWDRSKTAPPTISPADPVTAQMATRHLRDPGVILFRGSETEKKTEEDGSEPKRKRLLLLFLVGETPTGGIHKATFQNALQQIQGLPDRVGSKTAEEKPLRILGPYFPGSADSLAILLKGSINGLKPEPEVTIITGSTGLISKRDFPTDFASADVNFQDTFVDASQSIKEFYDYLKRLDPQIKPSEGIGPDRPYIAWLSEAGTGRGQLVRQRIEELAKESVKASREKPPPVLILTYPVHISQLRTEAEKRSLRKDVTNAPAVKDADLPLPMSEAGSPASKDILPLFSSLETATMERALREILTAIHRERIRYVRVSATDPLDRIFLVHEIRKYCPNATIFLTSADLLYLHSDYNLDFQGARIISSYPLFGLNQLWTYPFEGDRERLQFPTPTEQGIYNATVALLDRKELMLEYGFPFEECKDGQARYPALWLGIVGRNGIWPVNAFKVEPVPESYTMRIPTCPSSPATAKSDHETLVQTFKPRRNEDHEENQKRSAPCRSSVSSFLRCLRQSLLFRFSSSSSAPLSSPTARSEVLPSSARRLGLSGNYKSPIGAGFLLLLGLICLLLSSLILLAQLSPVRRLSQKAWIRRGWLGRVFGDEELYCYRPYRRISLMGCCVSLLTISLFTSGVAMLPAWVLCNEQDGGKLQANLDQHLWIGVAACMILVFTLCAFIWLVVMWIISMWRDLVRIVDVSLALVVGVAMYPFVPWRLSLDLSILLIVSVSLLIISVWRDFGRLFRVLLALVVALAMIAFVGCGLYEVFCGFERPEKIFFFLRATELTSRVSVLLPALLVGLAAFLSFFAALRRWNMAESMPCLLNPRQQTDEAPQFQRFDHEQAESFDGLKALEDRVKDIIVRPIFRLPGADFLTISLTILILGGYWYFFVKQFIPSVDGWWFDWFFKLAFCAVPLMLVWALIRSFWLWVAVKLLLRRLSWHPLISQFAARHSKEKSFASLPPVNLMTPTPTYSALSLSVQQAGLFYSLLRLGPVEAEERKQIGKLVKEAESKLSAALGAEAKGNWQEALQKRRCSQAALAELSERVTSMLEDSWQAEGATGPDAEWRKEGKFFLITHVVAFLQHIFAHLQNLVGLVTMGLLLMLFAANLYPFQPREPLLLFSWVAILTSVVVTLYILFSANRDKTLSLLARTAPGKVTVTRDLVFRVLYHGVIPVVALLGWQFPGAVRQIFTWLNVFGGKGVNR